jgi:hypothetical protein
VSERPLRALADRLGATRRADLDPAPDPGPQDEDEDEDEDDS